MCREAPFQASPQNLCLIKAGLYVIISLSYSSCGVATPWYFAYITDGGKDNMREGSTKQL